MPTASLWRNRDFMLLWLAQAVSQSAQNAVNYGLLVLVQTRGGSSAQMSIAVLTVVLPSVIFGLLAGAYVDRRDKRRVLIGTNALRAVVVLGYVFFEDRLSLIYATTFLFSTASQFFAPAEGAMIPTLVDRRQLIQANSLFHLTFTASQLAGLVLLGPLVVNVVGLDGLFLLVAVGLSGCAAILWPLPSTHRRVEPEILGPSHLWTEVGEVLGLVRADRIMSWAVAHWTLGATLALVMATLAPTFVVQVLGIRAEDSVFVLAPAGLGMVAGTALLTRLGQRIDRRHLIDLGVLVVGLALGFLGTVGTLSERLVGAPTASGTTQGVLGAPIAVGIAMLTALVAGVAFVAIVVPAQTIIQERAPVAVRGRVFAVQLVVSNLTTVVPLLVLGELADAIGVEWTLLLVGSVVVCTGLIGSRRDRTDHRAPAPDSAS